MSEIDITEEEVTPNPSVREIFNCVSQLEGVIPPFRDGVEAVSQVLWPSPQIFYDFLTKEVATEVPENLWRFFRVNPEGIAQPAVYLMEQVFEMTYNPDSQPMISEELSSKSSWHTFQELSLEVEFFSMCYPLDLVIGSLELLKEIRIKNVQKKRELRKKHVTGLADFAKKSKILKETEAGKDPSLPYTSTQSRIMNTCKCNFASCI